KFSGRLVQCFQDTLGKYSFSEIVKKDNHGLFKPMQEYPIQFLRPNKVYWIRIDIRNPGEPYVKDWVMELLDYRISHLEVYLPDENGKYLMKTVGFSYPFGSKEFEHKNFAFQLPHIAKKTSHIYAKIQSETPVTVSGRITTIQEFNQY